MTAAPGNSREVGHDLLRQFAVAGGHVHDPYPMLAAIREKSPVCRIGPGTPFDVGGPAGKKPNLSLYAVFSQEYAQQVLADNLRFSSRSDPAATEVDPDETILRMDPPEHLRRRALIAKAFRPRILEEWSDSLVAATAHELIDDIVPAGQADLVRQLTQPFPIQVIAGLLGLPRSDWPYLQRMSVSLVGVLQNRDRRHSDSEELRTYFARVIADRRSDPRNDLISQLVSAELDGKSLCDDEIHPFLLLLLPAGSETTYRATSNLLFGLLTHPEQLAAVRADRDLLPQAIEEALRWEAPLLNVIRVAARDTELGGVTIPAGALVAVVLGAANRDPARYPDPDAFDIFRDPKQHMSFGDGPHACLGMHLSRLEIRTLMNVILDRLRGLRLDPNANDPHIHGLMFRSPASLPVLFDSSSDQQKGLR